MVLSPSLTSSAYQVKCLDLFWGIHLPNGWSIPSEATKQALGGSWFDTVQHLCPADDILQKAALAISLNTIGSRDDNKNMRDEGLRFYAEALKESAVALSSRQWKMRGDALLAAARLFSLYEASNEWGALI